MGFFPKNAGSRLFNAGFAISDEDSKLIDIAEELERDESELNDVAAYTDIGCADVVHLLHSLPRKGNQTELHAIVKTFEVLGISIQNLLEEAQRKEKLTTERLVALDQEIIRLNEELEQRREETNMLNLGLEELQKLEESLEKMVELETQDQDDDEFATTATRSSRSSSSRTSESKTSKSKNLARGNDDASDEQQDQAERNDNSRGQIEPEEETEAKPVAMGDAYQPKGEDLIETQKIIDLDRTPKTSMAAKLRAKSVRKRRSKKSAEA